MRSRDASVLAEGKFFSTSAQLRPRPCPRHEPTLDDLRDTCFSDYVRNVVLKRAEEGESESEEEEDEYSDEENAHRNHGSAAAAADNPQQPPVPTRHNTRHKKAVQSAHSIQEVLKKPPTKYRYGMSMITLPEGFRNDEEIGEDETGRGPNWQENTRLGDMPIPSPIKQIVQGIGGIYEYTFLDLPETTASDFREAADEYMKNQLGKVYEEFDDETIDLLERKFWKRIGPTMQPAMYGADMEGSLFGNDDCFGWNISSLDSCLQLLLIEYLGSRKAENAPRDRKHVGIPGVTTPYLYFGMFGSVFCAHTEDMNLLSINYLHAGAPKLWYAIPPGEPAKRFEQFCEVHFHVARSKCSEYLRHKRCLISPQMLRKAGIPFTRTVQRPGDAAITISAGYHFGVNLGFNVAEATNFAVPEWIAYGKLANHCTCRPDSVKIDMTKFERLVQAYETEQMKRIPRKLSWREWANLQARKRLEGSENEEKTRRKKKPLSSVPSKQQEKNEFWVEVMPPPVKAKKGTNKRKKAVREDIWHLAKPMLPRYIKPGCSVLCIVPIESDMYDGIDDDEDEHCFKGVITETSEDHFKIHLDGFMKKDDIWMPNDSPKVFFDGGKWGDDAKNSQLPLWHYWVEEDSKRRCV